MKRDSRTWLRIIRNFQMPFENDFEVNIKWPFWIQILTCSQENFGSDKISKANIFILDHGQCYSALNFRLSLQLRFRFAMIKRFKTKYEPGIISVI